MEGAAAVAVAALDAVPSSLFESQIVILRHDIAQLAQIIILVDQANIQTGGTGMAVLAVDTVPLEVSGTNWLTRE